MMDTKHRDLESEIEKKIQTNIGPFKKHRVFFVHIPKNAGTSIMRCIHGVSSGIGTHATAAQINSIEKYKDYKNFIFCRDPFERFASVYFWRFRKDHGLRALQIRGLKVERVVEMLNDNDIQKPLDWGFEENKDKLDRMFLRQTSWMNENTAYIGRVESWKQSVEFLMEHYELAKTSSNEAWLKDCYHNKGAEVFTRHHVITAPQHMQSVKMFKLDLIKILNDSTELRNIFFDYYSEDYEKFGYKKPKGIK